MHSASNTKPTLLVTGGAGFIGSCFVRRQLARGNQRIVNLDKLTYAGNLDSLPTPDGEQYVFVQADIADAAVVADLLQSHQPQAVVNFAAESHVDRSIEGPAAFVQTNVVGVTHLLQAVCDYWRALPAPLRDTFRFLHISTDEVYGSLGAEGAFTESTAYAPNSPYSASKAASDHFVRAWRKTYGLPTLITNCSNNYGPYQFPEKLIPLITLNAIAGKPLPIYGDGLNIRDWLYVDDHCSALEEVLRKGRPGETYNIGGNCERTNLQVVQTICSAVQELAPNLGHRCRDLMCYVEDRPGHDRRYAVDATKIKNEIGWSPVVPFEEGVRQTVRWYLDNSTWVAGALASGV